MKELESLDKISGELERENDKLEWKEKQLEVTVYEEYGKIVSLLEDNNAGQNTDVQGASAQAGFPDANADINTFGEISMGHDGLKREMNQAPITSSTLSRENPSMNLQLAGSSGLTDMRAIKKRIADKKCREKRKRKINEAQERIKEHQRKNHKLQLQSVKSKAKITQLQKQLAQYRNISALMTSKNARRNALLEQVFNDRVLQNSGQGSTPFNTQLQNTGQGSTSLSTQVPCFDIGDQGNTSFHEDLNWLLEGYIASVERHEPEIELVEPPAHDEVAAIRAAHDPELENEGQSLDDPVFDVDALLVF